MLTVIHCPTCNYPIVGGMCVCNIRKAKKDRLSKEIKIVEKPSKHKK